MWVCGKLSALRMCKNEVVNWVENVVCYFFVFKKMFSPCCLVVCYFQLFVSNIFVCLSQLKRRSVLSVLC